MFNKSAVVAAVAASAMVVSTAHAQQCALPKQLNFGIISTESTSGLKERWLPFLKEMQKGLGVTVKPFFASDYAGVIEGMRFKKVDVAWFGNKSAIVAVDRAGGEVFAQTIKSDGSRGYYSLLITHKDSPLTSLKDVLKCDKSLTFGNGDPNSTSGFAIPGYYVWALNNKTPDGCFKRVLNANHETNAMAVAKKKVDVATNNTESIYARLQTARPDAFKSIKEIWRSPIIPSDPMVWRKDLASCVKQKIYFFFMQFGRFGNMKKVKHEREVLAKISDGWGPFLASSNAQLIDVRQIEAFKKKLKAERSKKMTEEQKKKAIAKANADLKRIREFAKIIGKGGY